MRAGLAGVVFAVAAVAACGDNLRSGPDAAPIDASRIDATPPDFTVVPGSLRCIEGSLERRVDGVWSPEGTCAPDDVMCWQKGTRVLRWSDTGWRAGSACLPGWLVGVTAEPGGDVWAVTTLYGAHVWRWDGEAWQETAELQGVQPYGIHHDASGLWVLGTFQRYGAPAVLRWDGRWWREEPMRGHEGLGISQLHTAADGTRWALAAGGAFRWVDGAWRPTTLPTGQTALQAIWAAEANDAWALGRDLQHWDGAAWTRLSHVALPSGPPVLIGFAADEVWTTGFMRWDGSTWSRTAAPADAPAPSAYVRTGPVARLALSIHHGWEGCDTEAWQFDGSTWTRLETGLGAALASFGGRYTALDVGGDAPWLMQYGDCQ